MQGDNRDTLKTLEDNSIDAIVTDPPYGIDFLGKAWDANTGALETYRECLRVLKPGGHILAFSAARTYHHLAVTLEQAGFEIRDQLMWLYSSGFPKAHDIGKAIEKRGIENNLEGWKTALKPAHEPIAMARKPFKGSTVDNVLAHGVGALNIDATRIPHEVADRFPSNVIGLVEGYQKFFYCPKVSRKERHIGFDTTVIPTNPNGILQDRYDSGMQTGMYQDAKENAGNNHPTVKPVELMKYLIKLVTPPNSTVLDPFNGSGSTGMAAVELGHTYIGCELDPNYVEIAKKRIEAWNTVDVDNNFGELFE
jgi:site-specific DNA-methyltransferase (adenine-specific)